MTNKEKIEEQLTNDPIIKDFSLDTEINANLYIYQINFNPGYERYNGLYDCCLIENDAISYINHN